jgi:hypothetical protein
MHVIVTSWCELCKKQGIKDITSYIHKSGGLVYMDGANMNAQVQYTAHCYIICSHLQYCSRTMPSSLFTRSQSARAVHALFSVTAGAATATTADR